MLGYAWSMTDDGRAPEGPDAAASSSTGLGDSAGPPIHSVCPFLLSADGGWRSVSAAREHRCTAVTPPAPLAAEKQRRLCLTAEHAMCATYLAAGEARAVGQRSSERRRPVARTTPLVLDQGRLAVAIPSIRSTPGAGQGLLIGLLGIAFLAVLIARLATGGGGPSGAVIPVGSTSPSPGATEGAAATTKPDATTAPESTDEATAAPSPTLVPTEAKPTPTPAGAAKTTYKIKKGDTLSGIAAKFGTTVKALVKLNKIEDPSKIHVGQVLKLP
jgi:LysM repeat protein